MRGRPIEAELRTAVLAIPLGDRATARALGISARSVGRIREGAAMCGNRHSDTIRVACERGHFLAEVGRTDTVVLKLRCWRCDQDVTVSVEKGRISYPALT